MNICSAEDLCLNGAITSGSERYQGQWSLGEAVQLELPHGHPAFSSGRRRIERSGTGLFIGNSQATTPPIRTSNKMLDCLIIGGGPAGLLAALYLGRYCRTVRVIDQGC